MKKTKPTFKLEELDEDLAQLIDEASEVSGSIETSEKKTVAKENTAIYIELNENDDEFSIPVKELINNSNITLQDIYDIKGQRDGYNMVYSFIKKGQLGIPRIKEWAKMLHKKPVLTFVDMTDEEIAEADAQIKAESNKKKK